MQREAESMEAGIMNMIDRIEADGYFVNFSASMQITAAENGYIASTTMKLDIKQVSQLTETEGTVRT